MELILCLFGGFCIGCIFMMFFLLDGRDETPPIIEPKQPTILIERPNVIPIKANILIPMEAYQTKEDSKRISEFVKESLSKDIARELKNYIEVNEELEPQNCAYRFSTRVEFVERK